MPILSYVHLFCCITYGYMAVWILYRNRGSRSVWNAAALFVCFALWSFGNTVVHNPYSSLSAARIASNISAIGGIPFAGVFFWLAVSFTDDRKLARLPIMLALIVVIPITFFCAQLGTNAIASVTSAGPLWYGWKLGMTRSVWAYAYFAYTYLCLIAGIVLFLHHAFRTVSPLKRRQGFIIGCTGLLTAVAGTAAMLVMGWFAGKGPHIADITFLVWAAGILFAVSRYRLLTLTPASAAEEIVRTIGDMLLLVSCDGGISFANPAVQKITGYSRKDLESLTWKNLIHPSETHRREMCADPVAKSAANLETSFAAKNGARIPVLLSTTPMHDDYGEPKGAVCVARDLTTHRKIERELSKTQRLESFELAARGVAHDFNNLLTAISGNVSLACRFGEMDESARDKLNAVQRALESAVALTSKLAGLSPGKKNAGETASTKQIIEDASRLALSGTNVTTRLVIPADLPAIGIDRHQIMHVLMNLLINAAQSMPEGGTVKVVCDQATAQDGQACVRISVSDSGSGILPENRERIFEPFFTTKENGSGLGLAVATTIVKQHGGTITVDSREGVGSTFILTLPCAASAATEPREPGEQRIIPKLRVLLMEDDEEASEVIGAMIESLGHDVESAVDGNEVIEKFIASRLHGRPYDILFLDLVIAGGKGAEQIIQRLRDIAPEVRALVISGHQGHPVLQRYREYGFCGAVTKPFTREVLAKALEEAIAEAARS